MYTILALGLVIGVAVADVSLGYRYDKPKVAYGSPGYQTGSSSSSSFSSASSLPSGNVAFSVIGGGYPVAGSNLFSTSNNNYEFSQSSAVSSSGPSFTTGTLDYNSFGSVSGSGLGSNYNSGSSGLNYNTGSLGGSDYSSNYNTFNSGGVASGSGSNYNTAAVSSGSSGLNSNYNAVNAVVSSGSGLDSNYNAVNSGVASASGADSNYNAVNSGVSSVPGSNSNYNAVNSGSSGSGSNSAVSSVVSSGSGYDSNYNAAGGSNYNAGSGSSYNTVGSSNYNAGSGSGYNTASSGSLSSSGFNAPGVAGSSLNTGSTYNTGGSSSYNTGSGSGFNAAGSSNYNAGSDSNYNNAGSSSYNTGSSSNYNTAESSNYNTGSGSGYNTASSGSLSSSGFNVAGGAGYTSNTGPSYNYLQGNQGSGISFLQNYQTVPSVTVDTSSLDKIGNHYQSASSANQFISHSYGNTQQEYVNVVNSNQPAQVFKDYYVFAAPEEPEIVTPRAPIVLPPPKKHYKIIFIKAPTQPQPQPQIITVPEQNEEKTVVYVLVKKPEDAKNIVLPKFDKKAPSKPEVFFIKYNNPLQSQSLIDNIVGDYNKGGYSATFSGAGVSSLTSKSGSEDSSSGGSTSSSSASVVSESDLTDTIQSIFGANAAESEGPLNSVGSTVSTSQTDVPNALVASSGSSFSSEFESSDLSSSDAQSTIADVSGFNTESVASVVKPTLATGFGLSSSDSSSSGIVSGSVLNKDSVGADRFGSAGFNLNSVASQPSVSFVSDSKIVEASSLVTKPSTAYIPSQSSFSTGSSNLLGSESLSGSSSVITKPVISFGSSYLSGSQSVAEVANSDNSDSSSSSNLIANPITSFGSTYSSESQSSDSSNSIGSGSLNLGSGSNRFGSESSVASGSSFSSGLNKNYNLNAISTSQGVPHVTYGVPKFRA